MSRTDQLLHWLPRVLGIFYVLFLSLFALDVWSMGRSFWEKLAGFVVHLTPSYVVIIALLVSWKWQTIGGVLFLVVFAAFMLFFGRRDWQTVLFLGAPLILIGGLFILDGRRHRVELRPRI